MAKWLIRLAGKEVDLKTLSKQFVDPICHVAEGGDSVYHLTSTTFNSMLEASEVYPAACDLLPLVNDLMRFHDSSYQETSLDSVIRINEDGTQSRFVFASVVLGGSGGGLSAEGIVIGPNGKIVPSPEPAISESAISQARLKLAQQNHKVREALAYCSRCTPGDISICFNANKVFEIIREDMACGRGKGERTREIKAKGWATQDELENFGAWANNPAISGDKARHAEQKAMRPGIISLNDAEAAALIRRLFGRWLDWNIAGRS